MSEDINLTVDWADVLRQAVENERWKTMRRIYREMDGIAVTQPRHSSYGTEAVSAAAYKARLIKALDEVEAEWIKLSQL